MIGFHVPDIATGLNERALNSVLSAGVPVGGAGSAAAGAFSGLGTAGITAGLGLIGGLLNAAHQRRIEQAKIKADAAKTEASGKSNAARTHLEGTNRAIDTLLGGFGRALNR